MNKGVGFWAIWQTWIKLHSTIRVIAYGVWKLYRLRRPIVTIFGGTRAKLEDRYAKQAAEFARLCVENGYAVITGGGPGIMQAANCGAAGYTLGIGVCGIDDEFQNPCAQVFKVRYFFQRKWLLTYYSVGFIVFPGGIGTADELFELLNFVKHGYKPHIKVVLIDKEFWRPLMGWLNDKALKEGFTKQEHLVSLLVTDDLNEAIQTIVQSGT